MELVVVDIDKPEDLNVILGQAHFVKTVEDLHEVLVGSSPHLRFGLAFCEASGKCLVRHSGNDPELEELAARNALALGAGHSFVVFVREGYPVNVLNQIKQVSEVCTIYCATANPVQVVARRDRARARCPRCDRRFVASRRRDRGGRRRSQVAPAGHRLQALAVVRTPAHTCRSGPMPVEVFFAGLPVSDFAAASAFYDRLFGRPADVVVKDDEEMWQVTDTAWLYLVFDPIRGGHGLVTLAVDDLDDTVAQLEQRGLESSEVEVIAGAGRKATVIDPEGNRISFVEVERLRADRARVDAREQHASSVQAGGGEQVQVVERDAGGHDHEGDDDRAEGALDRQAPALRSAPGYQTSGRRRHGSRRRA